MQCTATNRDTLILELELELELWKSNPRPLEHGMRPHSMSALPGLPLQCRHSPPSHCTSTLAHRRLPATQSLGTQQQGTLSSGHRERSGKRISPAGPFAAQRDRGSSPPRRRREQASASRRLSSGAMSVEYLGAQEVEELIKNKDPSILIVDVRYGQAGLREEGKKHMWCADTKRRTESMDTKRQWKHGSRRIGRMDIKTLGV